MGMAVPPKVPRITDTLAVDALKIGAHLEYWHNGWYVLVREGMHVGYISASDAASIVAQPGIIIFNSVIYWNTVK